MFTLSPIRMANLNLVSYFIIFLLLELSVIVGVRYYNVMYDITDIQIIKCLIYIKGRDTVLK